MDDQSRATATVGLWFLSAIVLVALFISAAIQGTLTPAHVALALVILSLAAAGTIFVYRLPAVEAQQTKAKRRRLDNLLNDMSEEELTELRQRLNDSDSGDAHTITYIGDDGELVQRK